MQINKYFVNVVREATYRFNFMVSGNMIGI